MVVDVGYWKKVIKRLITLIITIARYIFSVQNGSILYAIFDCIYNIFNGGTNHKKSCKKDKVKKKDKCNNSTKFGIYSYYWTSYMGNSKFNR